MKRPPAADVLPVGGCGTFLVHFGDETLGGELCAHLRRAGFACEPRAAGVVAVSRPGNEATRRELEGYLRLWHVMHPEAPAFLTSP